MDEMTLLRSMREDVAEPSETALNTGRAALLNGHAPHKTHRGLKRAGWTSLSALGATALIAVLVATNVVGLAGWRGGAEPAAADSLNSAALAAIQNSDPVVGPGQYLNIATTSAYLNSTADNQYLEGVTENLYVPANKTDDWVWVRPLGKPVKTFGPASAAYAQRDYDSRRKEFPNGDGTLRAAGGAFYGSPATPSLASLAALPRDPYRLLNAIYLKTVGQGSGPDDEAFVFIADTLRSGLAPADLRAALYRAAALIPGVKVTHAQATLNGRTGIAIGHLEGGSIMQEIIVDPDTGLLIGEQSVTLKKMGEIPAGGLLGSTSIETSVVNSAPSGGTVCGDAMRMTAKGCQANG
jgi:RNA polymerase sigma-70 factor (ECF subfamily)